MGLPRDMLVLLVLVFYLAVLPFRGSFLMPAFQLLDHGSAFSLVTLAGGSMTALWLWVDLLIDFLFIADMVLCARSFAYIDPEMKRYRGP